MLQTRKLLWVLRNFQGTRKLGLRFKKESITTRIWLDSDSEIAGDGDQDQASWFSGEMGLCHGEARSNQSCVCQAQRQSI